MTKILQSSSLAVAVVFPLTILVLSIVYLEASESHWRGLRSLKWLGVALSLVLAGVITLRFNALSR
jgi:hypothetical protein